MDIRNKLKDHGITVTEFAMKLQVSRSTLYTYFDNYEKSKKIENEKIQYMFDYLFDGKNYSSVEFKNELDRFNRMITRESSWGLTNLSISDTDKLVSLFTTIVSEFKSEKHNPDIYILIDLILREYNNDIIFKHLSEYLLTVNLVNDISDIEPESLKRIADYHDFFNKVNDSNYESIFDENKISILKKELNDKRRKIAEENEKKSLQIEKIIQEKLKENPNLFENKSELSVQDIINLLNKK